MVLLPHLGYALAWASFGAGHSLLASPAVKARLMPRFGAGYRLAYNGFAGLHLALVWLAGSWLLGDLPPFARPTALVVVQDTMALVGALVFVVALAGYDLGRLGGTSQWRARFDPPGAGLPVDEPLRICGLHRYVRHPVYAGAYLMLWGGAADQRGLAVALWASLYLAIGTLYEERKLLALYGEAYRAYRARVPMLVPWRGAL